MNERNVVYRRKQLRYRIETRSELDGRWRDRFGFRTIFGAKAHAWFFEADEYRIVDSWEVARDEGL